MIKVNQPGKFRPDFCRWPEVSLAIFEPIIRIGIRQWYLLVNCDFP
jgi:hypothetical protein